MSTPYVPLPNGGAYDDWYTIRLSSNAVTRHRSIHEELRTVPKQFHHKRYIINSLTHHMTRNSLLLLFAIQHTCKGSFDLFVFFHQIFDDAVEGNYKSQTLNSRNFRIYLSIKSFKINQNFSLKESIRWNYI